MIEFTYRFVAPCSFQLQVSAIQPTAPETAIKCAAGKPSSESSFPQRALPAVIALRNTVTNISPRPIGHADKLFDENGNLVNVGTRMLLSLA
jgi:hypothetical protein